MNIKSGIAAMVVFADGNLDWDYYLNSLLDLSSARHNGVPFRRCVGNNILIRVILVSTNAIKGGYQILASNVRDGVDYAILHPNNRTVFNEIAKQIMNAIGWPGGKPEALYQALDAVVFNVDDVFGAVFFLFFNTCVDPSPIVICPKCGCTYDLSADSQLITDYDVERFFGTAGSLIVGRSKNADLLMKVDEISADNIKRAKERIRTLRIDPSYRWSCNSCRAINMGYPGSFIMYEF